LSQDGFEDKEEGLKPVIDVKAEAQKEGAYVWVKEAGIKYKVYPELGQKTGFYCDQRENRLMIQSLSKGKRVLDLFCYTGGFALNGKER
jgi:23S rRNA (cytosine1962-C5)-methyltransferase